MFKQAFDLSPAMISVHPASHSGYTFKPSQLKGKLGQLGDPPVTSLQLTLIKHVASTFKRQILHLSVAVGLDEYLRLQFHVNS